MQLNISGRSFGLRLYDQAFLARRARLLVQVGATMVAVRLNFGTVFLNGTAGNALKTCALPCARKLWRHCRSYAGQPCHSAAVRTIREVVRSLQPDRAATNVEPFERVSFGRTCELL